MTGMLNRETFFAALDGSRRKADRGALLIIDADHFKTINDNYGHLTGDDALLLIAAAIERGVRGGDVLGRIGGEEFAAFLVGATEPEARRVAERIRREVELVRFRPVDERTVPLTVSIGGITCGESATVSELRRAADRRLYEAKHRGRNLSILDRDVSDRTDYAVVRRFSSRLGMKLAFPAARVPFRNGMRGPCSRSKDMS
jgi:diguanylate cyclase (GGDEF)-like protein